MRPRRLARRPRERPQGTWAQLRSLNLTVLLPPLAAVGVLLVVVDAETWWHGIALSLGVLAALVAFARWAAGDVLRVAVPCLLVTGAVWPLGVLVLDTPRAFWGVALTGPLVVQQLSRHRGTASVALVAFVAVTGVTRLLVSDDPVRDTLISYAIIPATLTLVGAALAFPNKGFSDLLRELEQSREREAELAVVRERMRFASDLHDIQGHTLHVVKLKITLAEKLLRSDLGRAREELREVHALVGDTISQTKELAYAQRRLNLATELENAKNLFEAAGIQVRVDREAEVDPRAGELLGQVLRETTTNILRHAEATRVRITLSEAGISIVNDGVREGPSPELRGLRTLRERVAGEGGELAVRQRDGRFVTAATLPAPRAGQGSGGRDDR
ncbi:sensor histidine kinase [Actinoalloteichus caeruleus]|uniref:Two-component system, NarL family, sensor histidine kinase DesK n=1 Tax=Actinoalloteichus caeruleus DSM 43889 TaxID=1120930 RepID=A0ABT1JGD7_ACTCY|nr:histidine kinase [Actinoalloteichus caeruleus]MCP2330836.1 two-component system, NarL family, sensor histidine kinase DesK [Actinoalloteichus caeruleus DSM 43889]